MKKSILFCILPVITSLLLNGVSFGKNHALKGGGGNGNTEKIESDYQN
jgi:hypothetical protein